MESLRGVIPKRSGENLHQAPAFEEFVSFEEIISRGIDLG
jgi:hypothetical protein